MRTVLILLILCGVSRANLLTNLPADVVALYNGDGTNAVWYDVTTNEFHLTSTNPPTRSAPGYVWSATETNQWTMDGAYSTNFTRPALTFAVWFKSPSNTVSRDLCAIFRGGGEPYIEQVGAILGLDYNEPTYWTNGAIYFRLTDGATDGHNYLIRHTQFTRYDDNRFHSIVATLSTNGATRLIVDGGVVTNLTTSADELLPVTWVKRGTYDPTLTVGGYRQTVDGVLKPIYPPFGANIGAVAFWGRDLTDAESWTVRDAFQNEYAHITRTATTASSGTLVVNNGQLVVTR